MLIPRIQPVSGPFSSKRHLLFVSAAALAIAVTACSDSTEPDTSSACNDNPGTICTWAGTGTAGFNGDGRAPEDSHLYWPVDVTFVPGGNPYILDWNNHRVREVVDGKLVTRIGKGLGDGPDVGSPYSDVIPPGAPGTEINLNHPTEILPLPNGKLLLLAWHNHKLRSYDPSTGLVLVTCGSDPGFDGDGGPAVDAKLNQPQQGALDSNGNLYILDQRNQRIRKIDTNDIITTVAGTGVAGYGGDGGDPLLAQFQWPAGGNPPPAGAIVCDGNDRLYITDTLNHRIRRIDFGANVIETVVGTGSPGFNGDGLPGTNTSINNPRDVEFGPDGKLYFCDEFNHRVRTWDPVTGTVATIVGTGEAKFSGDGGLAGDATLNQPAGLAFDDNGDLYISDTYNHRIRRVNM